MRQRVLPEKVLARDPNEMDQGSSTSASSYDTDVKETIYAAAITEVGLCRSTSQLSGYTNPYGGL